MNKEDNLCWYHGAMSRSKAEEILLADGTEYLFLVRESESSLGDYVLSIFYKGEVSHYQIQRHGEDAFFSIEGGVRMHGLETLIEHYQAASDGIDGIPLGDFMRGKVPPHEARKHGKTNLLHRATKGSSIEVVSEMLKQRGYANIDAKNQDGQTAVHLACEIRDEIILEKLIEAGANLNCRDSRGDTPLHYACRNMNEAMTKLLLEQKVNVQARNNTSGFVPLHDAAKSGNLAAVKLLLEAFAPVLPRAIDGQFPIDFAREFGHSEVVKCLEAHVPPAPKTSKHLWYHGTEDRSFAENILGEYANMIKKTSGNVDDNGNANHEDAVDPTDGLFLVRHSKGNYVLTMLFEGRSRHFIIREDAKYFYIDEGPYMLSLEHLIAHFTRFADGLPVNLRTPVKPEPKPPLPLFTTIPRRKVVQDGSPVGTNNSTGTTSLATSSLSRARAMTQGSPRKTGFFGRKSSEDLKEFKVNRNLSLPNEENNIIDSGSSPSSSSGIMSRISPNLKSLKFNKKKKKKEDSDEKRLLENASAPVEIPHMMKQLSFSTNFLAVSPSDGAMNGQQQLYNVPTNNSAINDDWVISRQSMGYFEESDLVIQSKRNEQETEEEIYFVDKPPSVKQPQVQQWSAGAKEDSPASLTTNEAGYIVMQSVPMFIEACGPAPDGKTSESPCREKSREINRTESTVSYAESEFNAILQHQTSTSSDQSTAVTPSPATSKDDPLQQAEIKRPKKKSPNYFIPVPELILGEAIGNGEFGSVIQGMLRRLDENTGEEIDKPLPVAIKTLHDEHCRANREEFLREASVMIQLKHHCIVKLIGITRGPPLMMVQELVPLGSMHTFLCENAATINPNSDLKLWASQIACGMSYLETQHFVHRDLAARNILLASMHQVKISDFGLSRALALDNDYYRASQGGKWPIKWYAPESFNYGTFSHASDVWSFGVTLWEMFAMGDPPYGLLTGKEVIEQIESGIRLERPEMCPENIYETMENCWRYTPKDRPTFRHLTEFFSTQPEYTNLTEMIKTEHIG